VGNFLDGLDRPIPREKCKLVRSPKPQAVAPAGLVIHFEVSSDKELATHLGGCEECFVGIVFA
jgi:hypothetical protein